jgi:hypothetical protein
VKAGFFAGRCRDVKISKDTEAAQQQPKRQEAKQQKTKQVKQGPRASGMNKSKSRSKQASKNKQAREGSI